MAADPEKAGKPSRQPSAKTRSVLEGKTKANRQKAKADERKRLEIRRKAREVKLTLEVKLKQLEAKPGSRFDQLVVEMELDHVNRQLIMLSGDEATRTQQQARRQILQRFESLRNVGAPKIYDRLNDDLQRPVPGFSTPGKGV